MPGIYWLAVVLISVVGTLITDNLSDNFGVSLVTTTVGVQHRARCDLRGLVRERADALDPHDRDHEARGVLLARRPVHLRARDGGGRSHRRAARLGYWKSALIFAGLIALVYRVHLRLGLNAILAFWIAYILTRPLGASIGDFLSQPRADGGLGLGTTVTSAIFLLTILGVVVFLTITKKDRIEPDQPHVEPERNGRARVLVVANQIAAAPALVGAVRERATAGAAEFFLLIPNPIDHGFDHEQRRRRRGPRGARARDAAAA